MSESDPLATIRQAYRYVVAYERRVLDAIDNVDQALQEAGFVRDTPYRWQPLYTSFPSRAWAPDHWAWDHVPNYACRYVWLAGEKNAAGSRAVLLDHVADTAFEFQRLTSGGPPDPLAATTGARSILRWVYIEFAGPLPAPEYNRSWNELLARQCKKPAHELLPREPSGEPTRVEAPPLTLTTACLDLATLTDESALESLLVSPLVKLVGAGRTA